MILGRFFLRLKDFRAKKTKIFSFFLFATEVLAQFCTALFSYLHKKLLRLSLFFEKHKNILVRFFMLKRGRYNRTFLHLTAMVVVGVGIFLVPFVAETYPVFSSNLNASSHISSSSEQEQSITAETEGFITQRSDKPRDKIITYRVEEGDTLSNIAQKFGISTQTIKWANDLTSDDLTVGDELRILPVTGISHKVQKGDSVYSIAKKYDTEPQKIVDFPFNDFANPETFSLVEGQMLIVPDGIKPQEKPTFKRQVYIAQGPIPVSPGGFTFPVRGEISQFPTWYHMAIDITDPIGTPVVAAHNGTVTKAISGVWDGGYGTSVYIDNGEGIESHYAHLSGINVSVGQPVVGGKSVIGWIGMTGRTTGAHVHFEIRKNGVLVNPLPYVQ